MVQYLDELAESAALIGAVNCVVIRGGRLIGENTDGQGFLTSLRRTFDPRGKRVVLLGAGGAARAIAFEDTEILINATSVGPFPDIEAKPDLDYDPLPPGLIDADVEVMKRALTEALVP